MTLTQKLIQVYEEIDHVEKTGHNKNQNYDFVRAADMVRAVRKALLKLGVYAEVNLFSERQYTIAREKAPSAPFAAVDVRCVMIFHDVESGETITASGLGTGADTGDKAVYKAQTGATKYCLRNAFLVPDEADPEADESVDEGNQGRTGAVNASNEMPDFQEAQHAAPRPNQPRPVAPAAQETQKPPERPTSAPALSVEAPAAPQPAPALVTAATIAVPLALAAGAREPGDESASPVTPPPNPPEMLGSGLLPTETQLTVYRQKFNKLGDDLSTEGKLKSSKGLPINRKLLVFLLNIAGSQDAKTLTVGQWDNFFARVETAKAAEGVGLLGITKLVNRANGIEEKPKK